MNDSPSCSFFLTFLCYHSTIKLKYIIKTTKKILNYIDPEDHINKLLYYFKKNMLKVVSCK